MGPPLNKILYTKYVVHHSNQYIKMTIIYAPYRDIQSPLSKLAFLWKIGYMTSFLGLWTYFGCVSKIKSWHCHLRWRADTDPSGKCIFFRKKNFFDQNFWVKKNFFFDPKKKFLPQLFLIKKFFLTKIFFYQKIFFFRKILSFRSGLILEATFPKISDQ